MGVVLSCMANVCRTRRPAAGLGKKLLGAQEQGRPSPPARPAQRCKIRTPVLDLPRGESLVSMQDGLALLVLGFSTARELACLERTGRRFAAEDDPTGLSLPERAARDGAATASQDRDWEVGRGPGECWKQVLDLFDQGLFEGGVLRNFPVSALERTGWRLAYNERYSHRTSDEDLERVPPEARFVLAAGREGSENPQLALAALAPRDVALRATLDHGFVGGEVQSTNLDHGVYWYRWPSHSFGFSSSPDLLLWYADCGIIRRPPESNPNDRLSWNLESFSTGGWRAGSVVELGSDPGAWRKCLYYRL